MQHNTRAHAPHPARPQRPGGVTQTIAANGCALNAGSIRLAAAPASPPSPARDYPSWEELLGQR